MTTGKCQNAANNNFHRVDLGKKGSEVTFQEEQEEEVGFVPSENELCGMTDTLFRRRPVHNFVVMLWPSFLAVCWLNQFIFAFGFLGGQRGNCIRQNFAAFFSQDFSMFSLELCRHDLYKTALKKDPSFDSS